MTTLCLTRVARLLNSRYHLKQRLPELLYITDDKRTKAPLTTIENLKPGSGVVYRHYGLKSRLELGIKIKAVCRKNKLTFIVAQDFRLAAALDSDGLHLPEHVLLNPPPQIRLWRNRRGKILTAAAHSFASLALCARLSVDAALVSPVFATASHPNRSPLGAIKFQNMAHKSPIPVYALGGLNDKTARQLLNSSAVGLAGISAFF